METLSVKYICKLSALIILLTIGFIYKVPVKGKQPAVAKQSYESPAPLRYSNVRNSELVNLSELYEFVVHSQESKSFIML